MKKNYLHHNLNDSFLDSTASDSILGFSFLSTIYLFSKRNKMTQNLPIFPVLTPWFYMHLFGNKCLSLISLELTSKFHFFPASTLRSKPIDQAIQHNRKATQSLPALWNSHPKYGSVVPVVRSTSLHQSHFSLADIPSDPRYQITSLQYFPQSWCPVESLGICGNGRPVSAVQNTKFI